ALPIFEDQDKEEQDNDLRQEDDDPPNPGDQAIDDKVLQHAFRQYTFRPFSQGSGPGINQIHHWCSPGEYGLKDDQQDTEQDHQPQHRVHDDVVEPVLPAEAGVGAYHKLRHQTLDLVVRRFHGLIDRKSHV